MQAQQKNTVPQPILEGVHGDEISTLVAQVDKFGRVVKVEPRPILNLPPFQLPALPQDPNQVLLGDGTFGPVPPSYSLLDQIIITEEGGLVYDHDVDGSNFAFLLKES